MKTTRRHTQTRSLLRSSLAKKFGQIESLENRQVMANDFLAGTAFIDANNNGQLDFSESYLPDATIELRSADGNTLIGTRVTDAKGAYLFNNVTPGNYKLVNRSAPDYAGSATQSWTDISSVTGSTANSISVTLRSPTDLTASVDMNRFINEIAVFENVTVAIGSNSVTTNIGQLPAKLQGSTLNPNPGPEYWTLSVDLFNGLGTGLNGPYSVDASNNPVGSGTPHNGQRVAYLYNHYGREQLNAIDAAGLQLAVWELLYDADSADPDGDLATGNFRVTSASQDSKLAAQFYLTDSLDKSEAAIFLNASNQPSAPTTNRTQGLIAAGSFNFANVTAAKIGDLVWQDRNASGRFELGELPIPGATVNLYQNTTLIATETTDAQGKYLFDHLLAGTYKVEFLFPAGFTQASTANAAADDIDSDGPLTGNIVLTAGQINDTVDQGFYKLASLGDFVWNDKNGNGRQNPNEEGIANAQVNLLRGSTIIESKTTDDNGAYLFENLQPGEYDVQFITPTGYGYISPQGQEAGQFDSDGPFVSAVNLESGENERNIDQGYFGTGTIGNFVFHDVDADGIQDPTDIGINGVTVELLKGSTVVATTQTTGGGLYSFVVSPGTYRIRFTQPAGYTNVSPTDATNDNQDSDGLITAPVTVVTDGVYNDFDIGFYNLATIGNYVWHDVDADGIQDATEVGIDGATVRLMQGATVIDTTTTAGGGWYSFSATPGDYTVKFDTPTGYTVSSPVDATSDDLDSDGPNASVTVLSGQTNNNIDQGFYKLVKIGNFVWNDLDADGVQDPGEAGIDDVTVTLVLNGVDFRSTTTAGGGFYSFSVAPGTYTIKFTKPVGFNKVSPTDTTSDDLDSDNLETAPVTVLSGENNTTLDQGFYNLATIGNLVWDDLDADGIRDIGEPGIDGVAVALMRGMTQVTTAITAGGGLYSFEAVPGTYYVKFTQPTTYSNVSPTDATSDDLDSDGLTTVEVTLTSGAINNNLDLGLFNLAKIGNFVFNDLDADGIQDSNEVGIDGVAVALMQGLTQVTTATTAAGGFYSFDVLPGTYSVKFTLPSGYTNVSPTDATADDLDSDGLTTAEVTLTSGAINNNLDLGLFNLAKIGNFVFNDLDADGIQDSNEVGIDGVAVALMQGTTQVTTAVTAGGGFYAFDVVPGTYSVKFTLPSGYTNVSPTDATADDLDSDGLTTAEVTVASGATNNNLDLGLFNLAKIGNFVFNDLDADGIQDTNEVGIDGVAVALMQGTTQVTTAVTAGGGFYAFDVVPGTYSVKFTLPSGYTNVSPTDATADDLDSDGLTTAEVTVASGATNNNLDLGLFNLAKIGNFVFNDLDADGIQDTNEVGIDGVAVALMQGTTQVTTAVTAGGGFYAFDVVPGTYSVKFTQPTGFNSVSPANATSDDLDSDGLTTAAVTVVSGQTNNTVDQGFYNVAESNVCTTIDMQGNSAESGPYGNIRSFSAGGVTVNASAFSRTTTGAWHPAYLGSFGGGLGVTDSSEDGVGNTHTLDNTGRLNYVLFEFSQQVLVDAAYLGYVVTDSDMTVWIGNVPNAFTSHQTLSDAFLTSLGFTEINTTTLTGARLADINAGGIRGNVLVIAAQVDDTTPEDNFKIASLNVCVPVAAGAAAIGDFVWHDINGNGIQDGGSETGIAGATVTLVGGGADKLINGVGDTTITTTTDSSGKYGFANLTPGTQYRVSFNTPAGYDAATVRKAGTNTGLDSDGATSDIIVLSSGENNSSIDAGFIKLVKIGNYVWNDLDQDGLQEYGEVGIHGVQLTLSGTTGSGAAITQTTTTAANGSYQFAVQPGTYTVTIAASNFTTGGVLAAFTASPTAVGTDRGIDSNARPSATSPATLNSGGSDHTVDFGYYTTTTLACVTMKMEGNTSTWGTAGNIRTFSAGGISVKASAFARDSWGFWSNAYLGSYPGGLGVTDNSEGSGGNGTHMLDNVGRQNYILFEFSQVVTIDSAFLGYVYNDSDLSAWIGTTTDPFNNHRNLNDAYLNGLGYSENNDTTLTTSRTANLNAGNRAGNVLVVSASRGTQNDWFKLAELTLCATVPTHTASTKFFVVDDDSDRAFKYTSAVTYTSNFGAGTATPTGIAANPAGTNTWISDSAGKITKYDNNGLVNSSWNTGIAGTQGVSTNGTSIWTVSNHTDRVYFYSGAASFVPNNNSNPMLTHSFGLHLSNSNPKDLATDGNTVWVVDDGSIDFVYAYTTSGRYLGRWQLDYANSKPTGITIDPTGGSKIWIVDNGTDRIYEYSGATGCRSGGMNAAKSYALHTGLGNTNPQGIADPPTFEGDRTTISEALAASLLVDGSFVNSDVNPYYNVLSATDVNDDGLTTAIDALMIINRLNSGNAGKLSTDAVAAGEKLDFADVNNDGSVSPLDALLVINQLNQGTPATVQAPVESDNEPVVVEASDNGTSAADQVFADLGLAEGEMASAFLFDADFTGPRRKR